MDQPKLTVVATARGFIPRDQLQVSVELIETDNALVVSTVWRLKADGPDGAHVKRDAHAIMFAPPGIQAEAGATGRIPGSPSDTGPDVTVGLSGQSLQTALAQLS